MSGTRKVIGSMKALEEAGLDARKAEFQQGGFDLLNSVAADLKKLA